MKHLSLGFAKPPRNLSDLVERVIDLAWHLEVTFHHVKKSTNLSEDSLAEEISCSNLKVSDVDIQFLYLLLVVWFSLSLGLVAWLGL